MSDTRTSANPLETRDLGKRYGRGGWGGRAGRDALGTRDGSGGRWALRGCSLTVPPGSVTALIGPNGAGKSTLLRLAAGLATPSQGSVAVFGADPRSAAAVVLPRIGFVAQDRPLYPRLSVAEMCEVGWRLNRGWDRAFARSRLAQLGIDPRQKAGKLSGGQQAQVALVLALAKHPDLILLDEPTASLDPRARYAFLQTLMEAATTDGMTVVLSSHNVQDMERVCDRLVILSRARVLVSEEIEPFVAAHRLLTGPRGVPCPVPLDGHPVQAGQAGMAAVQVSHTGRQTTALVRSGGPGPGIGPHDARWEEHLVGFEEVVLGYLAMTDAGPGLPGGPDWPEETGAAGRERERIAS